MLTDDTIIIDNVPADTLSPGDQIVVDGEYFIIFEVDSDRDDIDEVFIRGENLDGGDSEFSLYADDYYDVWAI